MNKTTERTYFTAKELFDRAVARAKEDSRWGELGDPEAFFDYISFTDKYEKTLIKSCQWDPIYDVTYGTSEGIYADIVLVGYVTGNDKPERMTIATFKTLSTGRDPYLTMGFYVGLVCYYIRQIVNEDLERFDD